MSDVDIARPILEDWCEIYGVKIEWFHSWPDGATRRVTVFGHDEDGKSHHHTLKWTEESSELSPEKA
jgi:hypothetical protein